MCANNKFRKNKHPTAGNLPVNCQAMTKKKIYRDPVVHESAEALGHGPKFQDNHQIY